MTNYKLKLAIESELQFFRYCKVCDRTLLEIKYYKADEGKFKMNFKWQYGPLCNVCYENSCPK